MNHQSAQRGSNNSCQVKPARVKRDGRRQVVAPHQLDDERLARWDFDRGTRSADKREHQQHRNGRVPRPRHQPQCRGFQQENGLRDLDQS